MPQKGFSRSNVNLFFTMLSALVCILAYHFFAKGSEADLGYHFTAEILKDLGVVVAGLAIVNWLWMEESLEVRQDSPEGATRHPGRHSPVSRGRG
jgi:hypothetical protein